MAMIMLSWMKYVSCWLGTLTNAALVKAPSTQTTEIIKKTKETLSLHIMVKHCPRGLRGSKFGSATDAQPKTVATAKKKDKLLNAQNTFTAFLCTMSS
jgi:hypothetical protein